MFEFTIRENTLLNEFKDMFADYVNKSYKFTMSYITNPVLASYKENERLILIVINKSVYQNLYSFLKLNDSNMQFAAFSCLEGAVNAMRLYHILTVNSNNLYDYITNSDFSLDKCELEILQKKENYENSEEFSLREFSKGLHKINTFEYKNSSISTQIADNSIYLGLSCGKTVSDELQNEVRKNLVGAYLSLQKHTKMFFNGGIDSELEEAEDNIYAKFLEYIKKFS